MLQNEKEFCGEWVVGNLSRECLPVRSGQQVEVFYHSYSSAALTPERGVDNRPQQ